MAVRSRMPSEAGRPPRARGVALLVLALFGASASARADRVLFYVATPQATVATHAPNYENGIRDALTAGGHSVDFWYTGDAVADFGTYDVLVTGSAQADAELRAYQFNASRYSAYAPSGFDDLIDAVPNFEPLVTRAVWTGRDTDYHVNVGDNWEPASLATSYHAPFLRNAVGWAAGGTGLGLVILEADDFQLYDNGDGTWDTGWYNFANLFASSGNDFPAWEDYAPGRWHHDELPTGNSETLVAAAPAHPILAGLPASYQEGGLVHALVEDSFTDRTGWIGIEHSLETADWPGTGTRYYSGWGTMALDLETPGPAIPEPSPRSLAVLGVLLGLGAALSFRVRS